MKSLGFNIINGVCQTSCHYGFPGNTFAGLSDAQRDHLNKYHPTLCKEDAAQMNEFSLGYKLGSDGGCLTACHNFSGPLTKQKYFHLVDLHLAKGKTLCAADNQAVVDYARENRLLMNTDYPMTANGYSKYYPIVSSSGAPGGSIVIGKTPNNPDWVPNPNYVPQPPDPNAPPEVQIEVPTEVYIPYYTDVIAQDPHAILIINGYQTDLTQHLTLTCYDTGGNVIGVFPSFLFGRPIWVELLGGLGEVLVDVNSPTYWTYSSDVEWDDNHWYPTVDKGFSLYPKPILFNRNFIGYKVTGQFGKSFSLDFQFPGNNYGPGESDGHIRIGNLPGLPTANFLDMIRFNINMDGLVTIEKIELWELPQLLFSHFIITGGAFALTGVSIDGIKSPMPNDSFMTHISNLGRIYQHHFLKIPSNPIAPP